MLWWSTCCDDWILDDGLDIVFYKRDANECCVVPFSWPYIHIAGLDQQDWTPEAAGDLGLTSGVKD